jgi:hypothetical protein
LRRAWEALARFPKILFLLNCSRLALQLPICIMLPAGKSDSAISNYDFTEKRTNFIHFSCSANTRPLKDQPGSGNSQGLASMAESHVSRSYQ